MVAAGVIGSVPGHQIIKDIVSVYDNDTDFDTYRTSPRTITSVIEKNHYPDVVIYDYQYFNPCNDGEPCTSKKLELAYTNNHWAESWVTHAKFRKFLRKFGVMNVLKKVLGGK